MKCVYCACCFAVPGSVLYSHSRPSLPLPLLVCASVVRPAPRHRRVCFPPSSCPATPRACLSRFMMHGSFASRYDVGCSLVVFFPPCVTPPPSPPNCLCPCHAHTPCATLFTPFVVASVAWICMAMDPVRCCERGVQDVCVVGKGLCAQEADRKVGANTWPAHGLAHAGLSLRTCNTVLEHYPTQPNLFPWSSGRKCSLKLDPLARRR